MATFRKSITLIFGLDEFRGLLLALSVNGNCKGALTWFVSLVGVLNELVSLSYPLLSFIFC